jgi:hypothetical protein
MPMSMFSKLMGRIFGKSEEEAAATQQQQRPGLRRNLFYTPPYKSRHVSF